MGDFLAQDFERQGKAEGYRFEQDPSMITSIQQTKVSFGLIPPTAYKL